MSALKKLECKSDSLSSESFLILDLLQTLCSLGTRINGASNLARKRKIWPCEQNRLRALSTGPPAGPSPRVVASKSAEVAPGPISAARTGSADVAARPDLSRDASADYATWTVRSGRL